MTVDSDPQSLIGQTIAGRYRVESLLGEGGMGAVYLVQHTGIRKRLALKLVRQSLMAMPAVVARFEREAMASAHMDHPHVAAASDFGRTEDGRFYLTLEYVEGQSLRSALTQGKAAGPLPADRALLIARQITTALHRAHDLGIVHRDLKPDNIMLVKREGRDDFVKVLDFGLALVSRPISAEPSANEVEKAAQGAPKITQVGEIFGTPEYMAPEQTVGDKVDIRTDLYALGVILYEMLAGERPFVSRSPVVLIQQHLGVPPPPFKERAPGVQVAPDIEALVQRLLAKSPGERFQTPAELLAAIDKLALKYRFGWAAGSSTSLPAIALPPALGRFIADLRAQPRRLAVTAAVALGVVCVLGGLVWTLRAPQVQRPVEVPGAVKREVPRPPPEALAPQAELDAAVGQGREALEALSARYPADSRIVHSLIRTYSSHKLHVEAMHKIAELAKLDPDLDRNPEIGRLIVAALGASPEASEAAAVLMEQELGSAGVDLLYDLTTRQTQARWKARLHQSLAKPEVLAKASPSLRVALELRAARTCEAKRALLPRASREGDGRALTQLRSLVGQQGCGLFSLGDCWPCLRKDRVLQETISALEARIK